MQSLQAPGEFRCPAAVGRAGPRLDIPTERPESRGRSTQKLRHLLCCRHAPAPPSRPAADQLRSSGSCDWPATPRSNARTKAINELGDPRQRRPRAARVHVRPGSRHSDPSLRRLARARRWPPPSRSGRDLHPPVVRGSNPGAEGGTYQLHKRLCALITGHTPALLEQSRIGPDSSAALLITAGDNPERLHREGSYAALCGVSPVEDSSGKARRQRLNRAAVTAKPTPPSTGSSCPGCGGHPRSGGGRRPTYRGSAAGAGETP